MSLAREIGEALMFLRISHFFSIDRGDFKVRFYPTNISLRLWVSKLRKITVFKIDEDFLRNYLKPGDVVVDIGANIGFHTMISSLTVGKNGKVYSVEAHPKTYKALCGNIKFNGLDNVKTYNLAAGEKQGNNFTLGALAVALCVNVFKVDAVGQRPFFLDKLVLVFNDFDSRGDMVDLRIFNPERPPLDVPV